MRNYCPSPAVVRSQSSLGEDSLVVAAIINPLITQLERDAKLLETTWQTTGTYGPIQINQIAAMLAGVQTMLIAPIEGYIGDGGLTTRETFVAKTLLDLAQKSMQEIMPYVRAAGEAQAKQIQYVEAAGFRGAVIRTCYRLILVAKGYRGLSAGGTWLSDMVVSVGRAFTTFVHVCQAIGGVIAKVGEAVLKVPDAVGTLMKIAKWGGLAFGAWWLYNNLGDKLQPRANPARRRRRRRARS